MQKVLVFFASFVFLFSAAGQGTPASTVQQLFDAMASHDAAAARALFIPEASLLSVESGGTSRSVPFEKWLQSWPDSKDRWLERASDPQVLLHDRVAIYWARYEFLLNGTLHHCGVDAFTLLDTRSGWKIASVADTRETNCATSKSQQ